MEFCGTSAGRKEFMVDGLPADIGIGVVLPIRSSPLATGRPVLFLHWNRTCGTLIRRVKNSMIRCLS